MCRHSSLHPFNLNFHLHIKENQKIEKVEIQKIRKVRKREKTIEKQNIS